MPDEAVVAAAPEAPASPQTTPEAPATDGGQGTVPDLANAFSDGFDPNSLPAELLPAYKQMQAGLTRKFQENAQQRQEWEAQQEQAAEFRELVERGLIEQDPEAIENLLGEFGVEFEDEGADPKLSALERQVSEQQKFIEQFQAQEEARQTRAHIDSEFNRLVGSSWDDNNPVHNAILAQAGFLTSDPNSPLDIEAGYKAIQELKESFINGSIELHANAPEVPTAGTPATAALPENASLDDRIKASLQRHMGV